VIAISGGNVALFTILILVVFRAARVPVKISCALAIVALLAYARVAGSAPSVDRAIAAAVLLLAGRLFEHRGASMNVLGSAAVLALARAPTTIFDPGFILSFGATTAILAAVSIDARSRALTRVRARTASALTSAARAARGLLTATIAAELALGPMTAALFGRITCAGLILNFAAIPLMSIVQAGSFVSLIASAIAPDAARWSGYVVHLAARGLMDSSRAVEFVPWVAREVAPPSWAIVAIYYAALVIAVAVARLRRIAALVLALFAVTIVLGPHAASRDGISRAPRGSLRLAFLDVGQGDATLVVLPDGRALLVDAGGLPAGPVRDPDGGFDVGARVVARALRAFGVRVLDTFVVTHGDPDHIGGAPAVIRSFRPRAIWEGVSVPRHTPVAALRDEAMRIGAEWRNVRTRDRLHVAGVEILTIHPPAPEWERQRVRNDDSVVLVLKYGAMTMILPGDIGREGEQAAMPQIERSSIVLLKAPHHGSATSSTQEFLDTVRPTVAIVSAGRDNRFGHPAPVVVARYRAMGITMLSTAEDGAVIVDTDGRKVEVTGWASGRTLSIDRR
jgi:competence protein ComEC